MLRFGESPGIMTAGALTVDVLVSVLEDVVLSWTVRVVSVVCVKLSV
jgi:hypothetical protein